MSAILATMRAGIVLVMLVCTAPTAAAEPAPATETERQLAQTVVTAWLDAQNKRDWKAYQALYAPAFTGIRRVGKAEKTMARAAWMADRKAMFKTAMTVAAKDVVVTSDAAQLVVTFEQRWEQGAFADVGAKRIVLDLAAARTGTATTIVGEEMVTSRVVLNDLGCLRLHHPAAPASMKRVDKGRTSDPVVAIDVIELGQTRFACRVDSGDAELTTVEIAVVERGTKWTVIDKIPEILVSRSAEGETTTEERVSIAAIDLTPTERALEVVITKSSDTEYQGSRDETTTLYRIAAGELDELIAYASTSKSDVEDSTGTHCRLELDAKRTRGYPDLTLTCEETHPGDWWNEDPAQRDQEVTTTRTRYRWNGTDYEER